MRPRVLVVDDEAAYLELLATFVTHEGYEVRTAPTAAKGLEMARSLSPAVIFLDVMLPDLNGWKALSQLKADPQTSGIPVVMMSGYELEAATGVAAVLPKPVCIEEVVQTVLRLAPAPAAERPPEPTA